MKKEITYEQHFCYVCKLDREGYGLGDKPMVLIAKTADAEIHVHDGECLKRYEKLLYCSEEKIKGRILGICDYCGKPVRDGHKYELVRHALNEEEVLTTFPPRGELLFFHPDCDESSMSYEEYPPL